MAVADEAIPRAHVCWMVRDETTSHSAVYTPVLLCLQDVGLTVLTICSLVIPADCKLICMEVV